METDGQTGAQPKPATAAGEQPPQQQPNKGNGAAPPDKGAVAPEKIERIELATQCVRDLGIEIPALIDGLDDAVEAARRSGKIVLVKFTAAWCLNCQYVEATVFHDPAALAALRAHGVATFKADLTKDDAPGWDRLRTLTATGGIPLTAIYAPGRDQPVTIEAVYTTDTLVKVLDQVDPKQATAAR